MLEIKTVEIAGFASAVQALRLPFGKECRSKITHDYYGWVDEPEIKNFHSECDIAFDNKDLALMANLTKNGDEHAKVVRGINVFAEISAPLSFWSEADTYRVGTERLSSESTMHTIGNGGISIYNFEVPQILYDILGEKQKKETTKKPLFIETPNELRSVTKTYFGRGYEIWNNGNIYALPFDTDEVLPNGVVRSRHFDRKLIKIGTTKNHQGYYQIRLGGRRGKTMLLHRVLAEAFIENPNGYEVVNHKDGDKSNCSISNLEWCTSSDNNKHAFENGLNEISIKQRYLHYKLCHRWTNDDIDAWRKMRSNGETLKTIADLYGTTEKIVCHYTNGDRYRYSSEYSEWFELAKTYEDIINKINDFSALYKESGDFEFVIRIKEILPTSFIQKRVQMFSYQTLRRIYKQRRNHRLPMWHDFCEWIETLPFFKTLIMPDYEQTAKD